MDFKTQYNIGDLVSFAKEDSADSDVLTGTVKELRATEKGVFYLIKTEDEDYLVPDRLVVKSYAKAIRGKLVYLEKEIAKLQETRANLVDQLLETGNV